MKTRNRFALSSICSFTTLLLPLLFSAVFPAVFSSFVYAADVTLAWDPNQEPDLAGYRVYSRPAGGSYNYDYPDWESNETTCTIYGLAEETGWCFCHPGL